MDINTKYFDVTKKLKDSLKSAKPDEADIIASIIDEVNQAQKNYSNEISEEMRNSNMDDANRYILNAA